MSQRKINPEFWEDRQQARERLLNTVVLYGNNPLWVQAIEATQDGSGRGNDIYGMEYTGKDSKGVSAKHPMADPLFHRFRKLPPVGWFNSYAHKNAVLINRRPVRSRLHGLNSQNVEILISDDEGQLHRHDDKILAVVADKGYVESCYGVRPPMKDVLLHIKSGSTLAVSEKFAISRDKKGLRWLWRKNEKIGLFAGVDTVVLTEDAVFYREELQADPVVTVSTIKEF